ncbi:hypothetical protein [Stakelama tenebrarum]|uniref:Entry exclusion lipoprotein TrbK n=1 Tax=Stakelama tenebrarum TaxID=2711215 RepID=A0A6G6Y3A8_9SPHN|nr:hypothetical protein [Sphingosinithalassobacter tenebrarum]QIG79412.1 hypothetical protein G5C33_06150 [Sphingosinithalassobacter tenebrarum]
MRPIALSALALLAAGCATSHPGWSGTNATPFDTAQQECARATATIADTATRDAEFQRCMADKDWTRTR